MFDTKGIKVILKLEAVCVSAKSRGYGSYK